MDKKQRAMKITPSFDPANLQTRDVQDITLPFMYQPHTITALAIAVILMVYLNFFIDTSGWSTYDNIRVGLSFGIFMFLVVGLISFPSGPFIRPHPLIWKLIFGIALIYLVFLVVLLFQNADDARKTFRIFDNTLGVELDERNYATNCDITFDNVMDKMDRFVVAHILGWIFKALLVRDAVILWTWSIQWELLEICTKHMLPNFGECWWDQWILDVLICNGGGIYIGLKLCNYFSMREYEWSSLYRYSGLMDKFKRMALQFTPVDFSPMTWEPISSISRFTWVIMIVCGLHLTELNAFFLKTVLWIPPESSLNLYRLFLIGLISGPAVTQAYIYITDPTCRRIGSHAWVLITILITEFVIILKFGKKTLSIPPPDFTKYFASVVFAIHILIIIFLLFFRAVEKRKKLKNKEF